MFELIPYFIIIAILVFIVFFSIRMAIVTSKAKKVGRYIKQTKINELNSQFDGEFFHEVGLSLPKKTYCHVYLCNDKIVIVGNGITFNLPKEKIITANLKTDKEIEKAYVSSIGGAVGGALLFGPLGAMIGGRTKEKKSTHLTTYLIFTYEKDGNPDYIAFDVGLNVRKAIKFTESFLTTDNRNKIEITL